MAETPTDVLVAGYQDIAIATQDLETLVARVRDKQVEIEGAILVTHDTEGNVSVRQTGDHLGRKGAGWGGGVGVAVGLFAPPLLASAAVGPVAGGLVGKFVDHRVQTEIHDKIEENLPSGSAGIICMFDDEQRFAVERELGGALLRSIVQSDKRGIAGEQASGAAEGDERNDTIWIIRASRGTRSPSSRAERRPGDPCQPGDALELALHRYATCRMVPVGRALGD